MENIMQCNDHVRLNVMTHMESLLANVESCSKEDDVVKERIWLERIDEFWKTLNIIDPVTGGIIFKDLAEKIYPEDKHLYDLIEGYHHNLTRPEEKIYLSKIQNCGFRYRIFDTVDGARNFAEIMRDLQKKGNFRGELLLM